jgi:hypothetical protein
MRSLNFVRARSASRTVQILGKAAQLGRLAELPTVDPDDVIEDFHDGHDAPPLTYHIVYQDSPGASKRPRHHGSLNPHGIWRGAGQCLLPRS